MNRITIHDIMLNNLDDLMGGQKADVFYCDPPWGARMLKFFRTHNGQAGHKDEWLEFVKRLKFLADRHTKGAVFIEIGNQNEQDVISIFGKPQGRYVAPYKQGTFVLLGYGEQPTVNPSGKGGINLVYATLANLQSKPKSVFDPCVGLGMTAKVAKKLGMMCYANELNPKRADRTMQLGNFTLIGAD